MALTLTTLSKPFSTGDRFRTVTKAAADTSYPIGGYSLKPTDLGLASTVDDELAIEIDNVAGYGVSYDYVNQKLKLFSAKATLQAIVVQSLQSPSIVAANTTAEQSLVIAAGQLLAGDVVVAVSKPTAQAGLGIGGVRFIDTTHIGVTFVNDTGGGVTPTANETYTFLVLRTAGAAVSAVVPVQASLSPALVAANTTAEQSLVIPAGLLQTGDLIVGVSKPTAQAGLGIVGWRLIDTTHIGVTFVNDTGGGLTPTATETYTFFVLRNPAIAVQPVVITSAQSPAAVNANTTAEQTLTVAGLQAADLVVAVSKPTAQAGLAIVGVRAVSSTQLAVTFANDTGGSLTPTAAETYTFLVLRNAGAGVIAPVAVTSVQSPASVAANTTAEQTLTIAAGLLQTSDIVVAVSKPTAQAGLAIGNVRLVSATQVAVTFINDTGSPIVPTASETYTFLALRSLPAEVANGTDVSALSDIRIRATGKFRA